MCNIIRKLAPDFFIYLFFLIVPWFVQNYKLANELFVGDHRKLSMQHFVVSWHKQNLGTAGLRGVET